VEWARRTPPWLWCAGEGVRGVRSGKVVGHGGITVVADLMSVGDRCGTVHDPTRIKPFTRCTVCMRHHHFSPLCALRLGSTRLAQPHSWERKRRLSLPDKCP
jgi:hypothetical protein